MKKSTIYYFIGSALVGGGLGGGISTCSSNNDLYRNIGAYDQLMEQMEESPEKYDTLRSKEIALSFELSENRTRTVGGFLLTTLVLGAGVYTLRAANKKREEESELEKN